jgi:type IV pilus assembly protein PilW
MKTPSAVRKATAGFTLVEIMIALLIGVIGIVVIMQAYAVSENYKRTATSGGDAQINGGIALYMMERELRLAGFGLVTPILAGCQNVAMLNSSVGVASTPPFVAFRINPAGIPAGDANSDVLLIGYGNPDSFVVGVPTDQVSSGDKTSDFLIYSNVNGFRNGDKAISVALDGTGTPRCMLHEIAKASSAPNSPNCSDSSGGANQLNHKTVGYRNWSNGCKSQASQFNGAPAAFASYPAVMRTAAGQIFNIGSSPQLKVYAVRGGNLTVCDVLNADCTQPASYTVLVNGIVAIRGLYGEQFNGVAPTTFGGASGTAIPGGGVFGSVDRWSRVAPANPFEESRMYAAALAIVARSDLIEKPRTGTTCDATTTASRPDPAITTNWYQQFQALEAPGGTLATGQIDLSSASTGTAAWQCYRYKLFTTTVPLRNMLWKPI